ncbi:periplasmic protein CpxP/Spy [Janthinobacterium sp. CG_23.3]|uniref:Spy/CpxP family protein refolding chaperone n=1 Tax=Janthinobacterium sp. CG_23.3 TaxID=3349634 RepID=UPI0038D488C4
MNTLRKSLLIGLTALGMGATTLAVHAAEDGRHGQTATQEQRGAKHAERMAQHKAQLHDKLKLSAAQEPAWAAFGAAAAPTGPHARPDRAAYAKMTAPERLEKHIAMQKEHLAMQESRLAALRTFYAVLTPEQQKVLDANMHGGWRGGHRGHHGHDGMKVQ